MSTFMYIFGTLITKNYQLPLQKNVLPPCHNTSAYKFFEKSNNVKFDEVCR
jgi:hypothetical protein